MGRQPLATEIFVARHQSEEQIPHRRRQTGHEDGDLVRDQLLPARRVVVQRVARAIVLRVQRRGPAEDQFVLRVVALVDGADPLVTVLDTRFPKPSKP